MTDFRKRLLGICGVAVAFAGMANAQFSCGSATSASALLRAEGRTEQTGDLVITCTQPVGPAIGIGAANIALNVSPALAITSKVLGVAPAVIFTEALAVTATGNVQGVVTGSGAMSFTGVPTPGVGVCAAAPCATFTITITNVRVDATSLGSGPVSISESALVTASGAPATVSPSLVAATAVGIITNGLTAATITATAPGLAVCTAINAAAGPQLTLNFGENFSSAFKTRGTTVLNGAALGVWTAANSNTETGFTPAFPVAPAGSGSAAGANLANSATRIKIIFSGLPTAAAIYLPQVQATTLGAGSMTLVNSENGGFAATAVSGDVATAIAPNNPPAAVGKLTTSATGTATAIYEITAQAAGATTTDTYAIPVYLALAANGTTTPATISATVQFATGTAGNVPTFVVGSTTASVAGPSIGLCSTTLLFPFITNGSGFDTGLAIANTSKDALGAAGVSSVTNQNGTCSLTFFGTNQPAAAVTTPSILAGTTYAATLSSLAPGFQGYAIAQCNFLYAHSFAYVSYNLTQTSGVSMGYLGLSVATARPATSVGPESLGN